MTPGPKSGRRRRRVQRDREDRVVDIREAGADTQAVAVAAGTREAADTQAEEELAAPWAEAESDSPVADVAVLAAWGAVGAGD
jgi:hypothetical protein